MFRNLQMGQRKVTVLIPCYNEEQNLPVLYNHLQKLMNGEKIYCWEVLFVNDGSCDHTLDVIKNLRAADSRVSFIDFSRNFGKEAAMLAGFDYATGDAMIIMDADLQHPVDVIPEMLRYWAEGYDDVYARRITRGKESWLRKHLSILYYRLLQKTTRVEILQNVGDFRLLDRKCINVMQQLREHERNTKGMFCWIGFRKKEITFEQGERIAGQSSWNFMSLLNLAIDGITSFTIAPLRIATVAGVFISMVAFFYMCFVLAKTLLYGESVQGFPTLVSIILFLGGVQLLSLGIIGEYLRRVFYETKNRPVYVVRSYEGE